MFKINDIVKLIKLTGKTFEELFGNELLKSEVTDNDR